MVALNIPQKVHCKPESNTFLIYVFTKAPGFNEVNDGLLLFGIYKLYSIFIYY